MFYLRPISSHFRFFVIKGWPSRPLDQPTVYFHRTTKLFPSLSYVPHSKRSWTIGKQAVILRSQHPGFEARIGLYSDCRVSITDMEETPRVFIVFFLPQSDAALRRLRSCAIAAGGLRGAASREVVHTWPLIPLIYRPRPALLSYSPPPACYPKPANISKSPVQFKALSYTILAQQCLKPSSATYASATYLREGGTSMSWGKRIAAWPG